MRRKLYSSRQVKVTGIVYVPADKNSKEDVQKPALLSFHTPDFFRVKALIEKHRMVTN